jgi:hypothetical protein
VRRLLPRKEIREHFSLLRVILRVIRKVLFLPLQREKSVLLQKIASLFATSLFCACGWLPTPNQFARHVWQIEAGTDFELINIDAADFVPSISAHDKQFLSSCHPDHANQSPA